MLARSVVRIVVNPLLNEKPFLQIEKPYLCRTNLNSPTISSIFSSFLKSKVSAGYKDRIVLASAKNNSLEIPRSTNSITEEDRIDLYDDGENDVNYMRPISYRDNGNEYTEQMMTPKEVFKL